MQLVEGVVQCFILLLVVFYGNEVASHTVAPYSALCTSHDSLLEGTLSCIIKSVSTITKEL